jgi:hypothetical protein
MLERIKLLLNITDESKDALLMELIDNVEEFIINFTNNPDCIESLRGTVIAMVMYDYSRLGTEGLSSESYSGVSFGYTSGYGDDIMKQLKRFRKVRTI